MALGWHSIAKTNRYALCLCLCLLCVCGSVAVKSFRNRKWPSSFNRSPPTRNRRRITAVPIYSERGRSPNTSIRSAWTTSAVWLRPALRRPPPPPPFRDRSIGENKRGTEEQMFFPNGLLIDTRSRSHKRVVRLGHPPVSALPLARCFNATIPGRALNQSTGTQHVVGTAAEPRRSVALLSRQKPASVGSLAFAPKSTSSGTFLFLFLSGESIKRGASRFIFIFFSVFVPLHHHALR